MEFTLIESIRRRVSKRDDVVLGIGDDAAVLRLPDGHELIVAMDTLNSGVHFPEHTAAADIGWKSLAVNLSDLAAMGAEPAWCTLSLSLPSADSAWVHAFLDGFLALASEHRLSLVGGDTTKGPLSICVAVHGFVPIGRAIRRSGAREEDDVWVTGTLGDAAAALAQWRNDESMHDHLRNRLDRPTPRIAAGLALRGIANACIDVSDGLLADLAHILDASAAGAEIDIENLPQSHAFAKYADSETRRELQLGGGDDYELCFTAASAMRDAVQAAMTQTQTNVARIGRIVRHSGILLKHADGSIMPAPARGWDHFGDRSC
jgi:thiamine-monophosphate kinase